MPEKIICEPPPLADRSSVRWPLRRRRDVLVVGVGLLATWPFGGTSAQAAGEATSPAMSNPEYGPAARRDALCSTSNAMGTGLRGEYFSRELVSGDLLLTRTDLTVDFDSDFEWRTTHINRRPESVRWTGWIKPPFSGRYKFHVEQPSSRLVVAQQTMLGDGASTSGASIELAAGRFYPLKLELNRISAIKGKFRLEWTSPHGARYLIPRALMFLPSEQVALKR